MIMKFALFNRQSLVSRICEREYFGKYDELEIQKGR